LEQAKRFKLKLVLPTMKDNKNKAEVQAFVINYQSVC